ncbi:MAG: ABC transporter substrate-binding protein [Thermodesulfobacteriota bacterium]
MMKSVPVCLVFLVFLALALPGMAEEIIVYEASPIHMPSAGGWVAVDQGFYGNLNIGQVQGELGASPVQKVTAAVKAKAIAFGIDSPENILLVREKEGVDLIAVGVDFQDSAMRIMSWKPIRSAKDLRGNFGIWPGYAIKAKCAVGKGWEKQFMIQNQEEDIRPWLAGKWPLASAMTYDELILAQRELKKMGKTFYTIDYKDLGINWMDHVLFTTEEVIKKYPDVVQAVVGGRYKGFKWALQNPKETFEILKKVNESLDFGREMDAVGPVKFLMFTPETKKHGLGYVHPKKWGNVARDLIKGGLLEKMPDTTKIYTEKFPSGVMPK